MREHFPALTLAEEGTLNVRRYFGWVDDIFAGPRGGAFINNNPGASLACGLSASRCGPLLCVDSRNQRSPCPAVKSEESESVPGACFARAVRCIFCLSVF